MTALISYWSEIKSCVYNLPIHSTENTKHYFKYILISMILNMNSLKCYLWLSCKRMEKSEAQSVNKFRDKKKKKDNMKKKQHNLMGNA